MAIFLGNWLDEAGNAFAANARQTGPLLAGGTAAGNRKPTGKHFRDSRFARAARQSADAWNALPWLNGKDTWYYPGFRWILNRRSDDYHMNTPYVCFNVEAFADAFFADAVAISIADGTYPDWPTATFDQAAITPQTFTYTITYDARWTDCLYHTLHVFQVDPRKSLSTAAGLHTRLSRRVTNWPAGPDVQTFTDSAPFPFTAARAAALLFRFYSGYHIIHQELIRLQPEP